MHIFQAIRNLLTSGMTKPNFLKLFFLYAFFFYTNFRKVSVIDEHGFLSSADKNMPTIIIVAPHHNRFLDPVVPLYVLAKAGITNPKDGNQVFFPKTVMADISFKISPVLSFASKSAGVIPVTRSMRIEAKSTGFWVIWKDGESSIQASSELKTYMEKNNFDILAVKEKGEYSLSQGKIEFLDKSPAGDPNKGNVENYTLTSSNKDFYDKVAEELHAKNSILVFPEGTSHDQSKVLAFKNGIFHCAEKAFDKFELEKILIVPIYLRYSCAYTHPIDVEMVIGESLTWNRPFQSTNPEHKTGTPPTAPFTNQKPTDDTSSIVEQTQLSEFVKLQMENLKKVYENFQKNYPLTVEHFDPAASAFVEKSYETFLSNTNELATWKPTLLGKVVNFFTGFFIFPLEYFLSPKLAKLALQKSIREGVKSPKVCGCDHIASNRLFIFFPVGLKYYTIYTTIIVVTWCLILPPHEHYVLVPFQRFIKTGVFLALLAYIRYLFIPKFLSDEIPESTKNKVD